MFERGDVVIYKHAETPNSLEGTLAIIMGKHGHKEYKVKIILTGDIGPGASAYWNDPFFMEENCQKIGHVEIP